MPVEITEDLINGAKFVQTGEDEYDITRVFMVSGLESLNAYDRQKEALDNLVAFNVSWGADHPSIAGPIVTRISVDPEEEQSATLRVSVDYGLPGGSTGDPPDPPSEPDPAEVEVGATLESAQTNTDVDGDPLTLSHTFQSGREISYTATVEFAVPRTTRIGRRLEATSPEGRANTYVGSVNETAIWGTGVRTWLCTRIVGRKRNDGKYDVEYEFAYKPERWDLQLVIVDPETGNVPGPPEVPFVNIYRVYPTREFANLNL